MTVASAWVTEYLNSPWYGIAAAWFLFTLIGVFVFLLHLIRIGFIHIRYRYVRDALYFLIYENGWARSVPTANRYSQALGEMVKAASEGKMRLIGKVSDGILLKKIPSYIWEDTQFDESDLLDRRGTMGKTEQRFYGTEWSGYFDIMVHNRDFKKRFGR